MRHLEAQARISALAQGTALQHLQRIADRATERAESLEARHVNFLELMERVVSQQHARELDKLHAERKERRLDHGAQVLGLMAPTIGAAVAKKIGLPAELQQGLQQTALIQWLKSLSAAQFRGLLAMSSPDQSAALVAAYKAAAAADPDAAEGSEGLQ
jgi:hypothetical protein